VIFEMWRKGGMKVNSLKLLLLHVYNVDDQWLKRYFAPIVKNNRAK
jgi:hypothetical protein